MRGAFRQAGTAGAVSLALLVAAPAASAAPPNDNWANREVIPALPFTDVEADVATATLEATDPIVVCRAALVGQGGNTLWYSYTSGAATEYVTLSTAPSDYDTSVSVYEGAPGSFRLVHGGCNDDGAALTFQSRVTGLRLKPNTAYSIVVAQIDPLPDPATLNLNVAPSATYPVTKVADTSDGTCDADCSLREAVTAANGTPGAVLIPAGTYTLSGVANDNANASGDLDMTTGMAIYGAGAGQTVIDAANVDRVIHADPFNTSRAALTLGDVTLRDGQVTGDGGGLLATGIGDFTDIDSVVIDSAIASGHGGGVHMTGRGRIVRTVLSGNRAGLAGGGIMAFGNSSSVTEVRDSTLESNTSLATATRGGGGLHSTAFTEIVNSTIHGNTANFHGGGIHFTFTGSPALRSATVSGNTSDNDANGTGNGGGVRFDATGPFSVRNSVLADNTATDCSRTVATATVTAFNHLEAAAGGCVFAGAGDVTGSDPALEPLAANGGPTRTRRIGAGSPLVDGGEPGGCADRQGRPLEFDQRGTGFPRSQGSGCDKGAFESEGNAPPVCQTNPLTTPEDVSLPVTLACTDPEGAAVTYGAATAQRGTVTGSGAARTYTPAENYHGADTITFTAGDGTVPPITARIAVTVTPVNDAPVAAADGVSSIAGATLTVTAPGVLANDTDIDGDPLTAKLAAPANGTVTLTPDGAFVYTSAEGFVGTDAFTYVASDGAVASAPATVTIAVAPASTPPPADSTPSPTDPTPLPAPPLGGLPNVQPPTAPAVSGLRAVQSGRALRLTLSEPARVTIRLLQDRRGVRRGSRCVASSRPGRRCTRRVLVRSFTRQAQGGANTLSLPRLSRGRYIVEVRATDADGLRSGAVSRRLTLGR